MTICTNKMRAKLWVVALITTVLYLSAVPVTAQAYLQPEQGILAEDDSDIADYLGNVRHLLLRGPYDYLARVVVLPSFQTEWSVTVEADPTGGYLVDFARADHMIWMCKDPQQIAITRSTAPLDEQTAMLVHRVWLESLVSVRVPPPSHSMALDGTDYHFSCYERLQGTLSGRTHSPQPGTATHDLVALGELLKDYAQARPEERAKVEVKIQATASSLEGRLPHELDAPTRP